MTFPLALVVLGGVALMAMAGKKRHTPAQTGNGNGLPDVTEEDDYVAEEAVVESARGVVYEARIWRTHEAPADYLGELLLDPEGWTSGPAADDLATVRAGLQEMADSLDFESTQFEAKDPCDDALPGPFQAVGFDPAAGQWVPFPGGGSFMATDQPQTGWHWCVVVVESGVNYLEGRVTDEEGGLVYSTGPEADPDIAASKAAYVALQGLDDLPWPVTGGLHGVPTPWTGGMHGVPSP